MCKEKMLTVWVFCFSIFLYSQCSSVEYANAQPKHIIKFATVAPEGSTWMKHMRKLDKGLRKKSKGQLGFRFYAGGIAGDEVDVLKKMRIGQIHSAAFSGVGFGKILPMVRVLDLPFLFRNNEEVDRVHQQLQPFFRDQFRRKGYELLAWAEVGNVHLFSKKPIQKVKDLSGLKLWTWTGDPIARETFVSMGVNPIPLAITDVTTGLNTGMIDTVYAPPLGALALQWHSALKYMTELPLVHSTGAVLIASKYYKKLPKNLSNFLSTNYEAAMRDLTLALRVQNKKAIKLIQDSGLSVIPTPTGQALQEFYKVHDHVAKNLAGEIYPRKLLERVYGILKRR